MLSKDKIINVKFNRARKGYDIEQVDTFLDDIVADLEVIERERQADAERMVKVEESENALAQALLIAQKTANDLELRAKEQADQLVSDAQVQADEIINTAKVEAYNIRAKYEQEIAELKEELERIRAFAENYKTAVLTDMDRHKEAFINGFASEALFAASEYAECEEEEEEMVEGEVLEEVELPAEEAEQAEETEELQTENIGTINLDDILQGLPENDVELKALIDEIME